VQKSVLKLDNFADVKQSAHSDTSFSAGSLRAARRAAGAVQHAVDCVLVGRHRNSFCVVRPPGHHAGIKGLLAGGESCGFCIFNNVAAGALHAVSDERQLCRKVAIVDIDVHHGNGTEEIVRKCDDPGKLLFFSIHLFDNDKKKSRSSIPPYKFYPGTGEEDDLPHNIINVPIRPLWKEEASSPPPVAAHGRHNTRQKSKRVASNNGSTNSSPSKGASLMGEDSSTDLGVAVGSSSADGIRASDTDSETASKRDSQRSVTPGPDPRYGATGRTAYRRAIQDRLLPALRAFNPDLILISAGFDASKGDVGNAKHMIGMPERMGLDLEPEDYAWTTRKILEVADICCQGRVVSVLEGGYGRSPIAPATERDRRLDRTLFSEAAIRHLQAMIDPYDAEERFSSP
jgi:acetoin utilization deacetylase AcuC-like enzyme